MFRGFEINEFTDVNEATNGEEDDEDYLDYEVGDFTNENPYQS